MVTFMAMLVVIWGGGGGVGIEQINDGGIILLD